MKKIFLPLFIIILTLCCLLSACGGNNKTSNQNSTTNKTTASDVSESGSKSSQNGITVVSNELFFTISDKYLFNIIY